MSKDKNKVDVLKIMKKKACADGLVPGPGKVITPKTEKGRKHKKKWEDYDEDDDDLYN